MSKLKSRLVTDLIKLKKPIEVTKFKPKEAEVIAAALFTELNKHGGFGLSANQIGLDKRICVVNVKEPFFLENPRIVEKSEELYSSWCAFLTVAFPSWVEGVSVSGFSFLKQKNRQRPLTLLHPNSKAGLGMGMEST